MKTIHKFRLESGKEPNVLRLRKGFRVVRCEYIVPQKAVYLWVEQPLSVATPVVERQFVVVSSGIRCRSVTSTWVLHSTRSDRRLITSMRWSKRRQKDHLRHSTWATRRHSGLLFQRSRPEGQLNVQGPAGPFFCPGQGNTRTLVTGTSVTLRSFCAHISPGRVVIGFRRAVLALLTKLSTDSVGKLFC